ncbi:hypothetical protein OUZ56_008670 [Daphnia magna]|uniref:Uncharacterized protein n=1 Tax=Daphnia magna TaxID=35525 RepID=A0ABR0ADP5_9CRUS|nr:hypothetical protein OUZ56_008670 [Daphnia magna]
MLLLQIKWWTHDRLQEEAERSDQHHLATSGCFMARPPAAMSKRQELVPKWRSRLIRCTIAAMHVEERESNGGLLNDRLSSTLLFRSIPGWTTPTTRHLCIKQQTKSLPSVFIFFFVLFTLKCPAPQKGFRHIALSSSGSWVSLIRLLW